MKQTFKTKYGVIDLSLIGNNVYEMYDSTNDEYYGTIEGTVFTTSIVENQIDEYRMNLFIDKS